MGASVGRGSWRAGLDELTHRAPLVLAAQLTLASLLLAPIGSYELRAAALLLAAAGLLAPGLAVSAGLWLALAALAAARIALDWPLSDNHAYLLAYWCLALGLAFAAGAPADDAAARRLGRTARLLVGLVFALAALQKLLAPDYLDGSFFRVALVVDGRFEALGRLLGRSDEALAQARALLDLPPWAPWPPGAAVAETLALRAAAVSFALATLTLEGAVALAFLLPPRRIPARLRDASLLGFCAATYAIAPVAGFGWLLLALGVAQTALADARTRGLYLAAFVLLLVYRELPWLELLAPSGGS